MDYHPTQSWFKQCVTFNFFPSDVHELTYNLFNVTSVYVVPLLVITISYTLILIEMSKKYRQSKGEYREYRHAWIDFGMFNILVI